MSDFDPKTYYDHLKPIETPKKAPEQPQDERLSPSGTTRGVNSKDSERARQAHLKAMKDLGL